MTIEAWIKKAKRCERDEDGNYLSTALIIIEYLWEGCTVAACSISTNPTWNTYETLVDSVKNMQTRVDELVSQAQKEIEG